MKVAIALCVLSLVGLSYSRGCIYVNGHCSSECEEGTYSYTVGCGKKTPEPTCDELNPVEERGSICDFTACYCEPPTVRETTSNKCIPLEECPKKPKKD